MSGKTFAIVSNFEVSLLFSSSLGSHKQQTVFVARNFIGHVVQVLEYHVLNNRTYLSLPVHLKASLNIPCQ